MEDESVGKKRMIHDATHGVRVNHRIRCRDKILAPGAREKKQLLGGFLRGGYWKSRPAFQALGGGAWLPRLPDRLQGGDQGDPDSQIVYVQHWQLASPVLGTGEPGSRPLDTCDHHLLGPEFMLDLLLYADDLESLGVGLSGRRGIPLSR